MASGDLSDAPCFTYFDPLVSLVSLVSFISLVIKHIINVSVEVPTPFATAPQFITSQQKHTKTQGTRSFFTTNPYHTSIPGPKFENPHRQSPWKRPQWEISEPSVPETKAFWRSFCMVYFCRPFFFPKNCNDFSLVNFCWQFVFSKNIDWEVVWRSSSSWRIILHAHDGPQLRQGCLQGLENNGKCTVGICGLVLNLDLPWSTEEITLIWDTLDQTNAKVCLATTDSQFTVGRFTSAPGLESTEAGCHIETIQDGMQYKQNPNEVAAKQQLQGPKISTQATASPNSLLVLLSGTFPSHCT